MPKKLILSVLLCLSFLNPALYASAPEKNTELYNIPRISVKKTDLSELDIRKQELKNPDVLKNNKIGPVLSNFLAGAGGASITKTGSNKDMVRLIMDTTGDITPVNNAISKYDARIIHKRNGLIAIEAPVDNIENLVNETNAIKNVRLPVKFYPMAVTSEGLEPIGANNFHNAGHTGAGVRIAIIDVGFKGLSEAYRNGDIPYGARTYDLTGNGIETEYQHGTICTEIIYDMAPGAELYLFKVADEIDIYDAIDACIDNEIDIISFSLGAFGTGPGDGTGDLDEAFDEASANGILVVAAAGNFANFEDLGTGYSFGGHWEGEFYDSNSDNEHEFIQGDPSSYYNIIGAYPTQNDDGDPVYEEVSILMRWNDWPYAHIDYDIYLYQYDYKNNVIINPSTPVGFSEITQNGSQQPIEQIMIDLEDYAGIRYYALSVRKKTGEPAGTELEIYLGGTSTFIPFNGNNSAITTSGSSIAEPADAESVLAVGAIYYENWEDGPQEDFSSQGPTNAWAGSSERTKPDICGPDGLSTFTYGLEAFFGTSASTPFVAGAAALIKSIHPDFGPDELKSYIVTNAIDMDPAGKDNLYGWGRIDLMYDNNVDPDQDEDGMPDNWEDFYNLNKTLYDPNVDSDNDGYTNLVEYLSKTNPLDNDTDDDGISDGNEDANKNSALDTGETYATRIDSDSDCIQDGTETGVTVGLSGTDTSVFIPDADPSTTTDPMNADTDGDGLKDGEEDTNHNGRVDSGETDPNVPDTGNNAVGGFLRDNDDDGGLCFIVTAGYGSCIKPQVMSLTQLGDNILAGSSLGKSFVSRITFILSLTGFLVLLISACVILSQVLKEGD